VRHIDCFYRQHFCPKFQLNVPFLYTYCFANLPLLVNWITKYQVKLPFYLSLFYQQHHCWRACHHGRLFFAGVTTRTLQERRPYGFITAEIQRQLLYHAQWILKIFLLKWVGRFLLCGTLSRMSCHFTSPHVTVQRSTFVVLVSVRMYSISWQNSKHYI
jgi:hypothetical protein